MSAKMISRLTALAIFPFQMYSSVSASANPPDAVDEVESFVSDSATHISAVDLTPLAVDDLVSGEALYHTQDLSPDGRWIAFSVSNNIKAPKPGTDILTSVPKNLPIVLVDLKTGRRISLGVGSQNANPVWSPDGSKLAFLSTRDGDVHLWLWDRASEHERKVGDTGIIFTIDPSVKSIRWTIDSKRILARVQQEGYNARLRDVALSKLAVVSGDVEKSIEVLASGASENSKDKLPASLTLDRMLESYRLGQSDIGLINLADGHLRRLVKKVSITGDIAISPDGKHAAFIDYDDGAYLEPPHTLFGQLKVVALSDESLVRVVVPRIELQNRKATQPLRWSPDSRTIAFPSSQFALYGEGDRGGGVRLASLEGGVPELLSEGLFQDILWSPDGRSLLMAGDPHPEVLPYGASSREGGVQPRLWQLDLASREIKEATPHGSNRSLSGIVGSNFDGTYASPDGGRTAYFVARDGAKLGDGLWKLDVRTGRVDLLGDEQLRIDAYVGLQASRDGTLLAYRAKGVTQPEDVLAIGTQGKASARVIGHINPALERYTFGKAQTLKYRASGTGRELIGGLVFPTGYVSGKRYPMVVVVYPSNTSNSSGLSLATDFAGPFGAKHPAQLYATRGYAVLYLSVYRRPGQPMRDIADSVLAGIDKAIEIGVADPDKIGITGHSYGGYSVLSTIVQSPRFKAAVASSPLASIVSTWFDMSPGGYGFSYTQGQGMMTGTYWSKEVEYWQNSPLYFLDRVDTPLLLLHGRNDTTVSYRESDQIFQGMKSLGKKVEYRRYRDEGHIILNQDNIRDSINATIRWFDNHLKGDAGLSLDDNLR